MKGFHAMIRFTYRGRRTERGQTAIMAALSLVVLVSPRVELADERQVVEAVLDGLRGRPGGAAVARAMWRQAGTLAVRRAEPRLTPRGKLLPLHVSRRR